MITSVGVVVDKNVFRDSHAELESFFNAQVQTNKNLAQAMSSAQRINEYKAEGDYSYSLTQFVGNGFLMIGDAARFVDPIFSSGVSVALYSAKYAARQIQHAFSVNDFSLETFKPYETGLRSGVDIWYEFITLYYKLLPLFTYFIAEKRYRLQVLQLLQGEVFNRSEVPVLKAMRDFIAMVEKSDNHLFKGKLTDIPIDAIPDLGTGS